MTLILLFAPLPTLALVNFVRVVHKHVRSERFLIWFSSVHGRLSLRLGEHMTGSAPRLWDLTGAEIQLDGGPTSPCAINVVVLMPPTIRGALRWPFGRSIRRSGGEIVRLAYIQ
jgi:hypothetical protein